MGDFFNTIITQPLLNLLVLIDSLTLKDFGLAVVVITIIVRAIIWPLYSKSLHGQKALKEIQPEITALQKKYKDKPQELQKAMMELYKEKEVNPFASCLPTLLQLPLLIGLYWVFIKFKDPSFVQLNDASHGVLTTLYGWVKEFPTVKSLIEGSQQLSTTLFGLVDLAKPNIFLALLAGATQFLQTKMLTPQKPDDPTQKAMSGMVYLFPIITILISMSLPSALPLYWTVSTIIASLQQYLIMFKEVSVLEHIGLKRKNG